MPYKTFWYKQDAILFTEVMGELTEEDMFAFNREYNEVYITDSRKKVHLICDLRSMDNYPKNLKRIRDASQNTARNPGLGWIILIGSENPFIRFLASTVFQMVKINCKIVGTLEEAEKLVERLEVATLSTRTGT